MEEVARTSVLNFWTTALSPLSKSSLASRFSSLMLRTFMPEIVPPSVCSKPSACSATSGSVQSIFSSSS
eukprot:16359079-Heterocapsa_arctica.AAC.1